MSSGQGSKAPSVFTGSPHGLLQPELCLWSDQRRHNESNVLAAAAAKLLQSCPTLCDPIDGSPPGPTIPGILQARTRVGCHFLLQCIKVKVKLLSRVRLLATPWTAAYQAPPSMGFSRQEYWSGVNVLESSPNHSPLPCSTENFSSLKLAACAKKVGDHCFRV